MPLIITNLSHKLQTRNHISHYTFTRNFIHDSHLLDIRSSTLTARMQLRIRVWVELFTRPFLPLPFSPRPLGGSGNRTRFSRGGSFGSYEPPSSFQLRANWIANTLALLARAFGHRSSRLVPNLAQKFFWGGVCPQTPPSRRPY